VRASSGRGGSSVEAGLAVHEAGRDAAPCHSATRELAHARPWLRGRRREARWQAAAAEFSDLTLEFLAYAEGRFLTIHPFRDFNGRTIRLFLTELLRRLDLPRVELAPESEAGRSAYFAALEAADALDWQPLMSLWNERLSGLDSDSTLTREDSDATS
jgi:hypothetical protein